MEPVMIDGSHKEGGGQIIRTALALSVITGKPFEANDIRKGRKQPGLKSQHMHCIKALERLCNARTEGAELGSERVKFYPGKLKPQKIEIDIGTAGSITLMLQSLLLPCIAASGNTTLRIIGGTDTKWSMPIDYTAEILIPQLRRYADMMLKIEKRGYYPKGGGIVEIGIRPKPSEKPAIMLDSQGELIHIKGISHASKSLEDAGVADRQAESAKNELKGLDVPVNIDVEYCDTLSFGSGITLWALFSERGESEDLIRLGSDSLGERGVKAEIVGKQAAQKLIDEIKSEAAVDEHMADNLIPFLGIYGGRMKVSRISDHTLTNIYVAEKFLDVKFSIDDKNRVISVNKVNQE